MMKTACVISSAAWTLPTLCSATEYTRWTCRCTSAAKAASEFSRANSASNWWSSSSDIHQVMSAGRKREQIILKILLPAVHGIVAEGHFVCVVAFIPFRVAVGKKDVLTLAVRLPFLPRHSIGRAADAILRIIILVTVVGTKIQRVARQNVGRAKSDSRAFNRIEMRIDWVGRDVGGTRAVKIIERRLLRLRQQLVRRTVIDVRVLDEGKNLLHPAVRRRVRIRVVPRNGATRFRIKPARIVCIHRHRSEER